MAQFREMTASRVGGVKGHNATTESRIVRVIADEDEIDTGRGSLGTWVKYPDPRDLVENQWARLGSGHPWDKEALKAGSYRIVENRGQGCWLVEVVYHRNNIAIGIPPTDEWLIRYRGATVTEHVLTEVEPHPGPMPSGADPLWYRDSVEVGSPAFKEVPPAGGANAPTHQARGVDDDGNLIDIYLREVPTLTEEPRGMIVEDPAWLVTFERTIPNFGSERMPTSVARFMKAVNDRTFRGAPALHVKCLDIVIDPVAAEIPGQQLSGVSYRVMVSFLWSYLPWGPHRIVASWYDGDGHRATALKKNADNQVLEPDVRDFRNVRPENFNVLLNILERGW